MEKLRKKIDSTEMPDAIKKTFKDLEEKIRGEIRVYLGEGRYHLYEKRPVVERGYSNWRYIGFIDGEGKFCEIQLREDILYIFKNEFSTGKDEENRLANAKELAFIKTTKFTEKQIDELLGYKINEIVAKTIEFHKLTRTQIEQMIKHSNPEVRLKTVVWQDLTKDQLQRVLKKERYQHIIDAAELRLSGWLPGKKLMEKVDNLSVSRFN